jgi:[glutamine synthetase] adenylyltransferase / [glutamine synthetase]-adenylyl-L-tyrosine phosphorylase
VIEVETFARTLASEGIADEAALAEGLSALVKRLPAASAEEVANALASAGDPVAALHGIVRLLDAGGGTPEEGQVGPLLRLLGGSPILSGTLAGEGERWPALFATVLQVARRSGADHRQAMARDGVQGPLSREELQAGLRRHRRREMVRIGGRDLLRLATVDETVREISALAEGVIESAVECARARIAVEWGEATLPGDGGRLVAFCVLGMGKLGGEELNYSSDVDLVYVYERDGEHAAGRTLGEFFSRLAEEVTRALREVTGDGMCFRVDLRLRPGGGEGPVAVSLAAALSYYETWAETWERAVWLKARPVGGDRGLGEMLIGELVPFIYRRYLDYGTLEDLSAMKRRVDASLRAPKAVDRDVKLGRGGIREVEFFVQAQQLVHGGKDARLRQRSTLAALAALADTGYIDRPVAERLAAAYRFLRDVEHKLQIVQERQTQLLPVDREHVAALARRLGYRGRDAAGEFEATRAAHSAAVRAAFDGLFHGAGEERRREEQPEAGALLEELDQEERAMWRLGRLGFRDLESAYGDLRLLRDGPPHAPASARRRQALAALAPALIAEIARSAAPDRALANMATFVSTIGARTSYLHLLLENPGVMRLLVRLFASSEFLSAFFLRHPELLDSLVRADLVRILRSANDMAVELDDRLSVATDLEAQLDTLRRFRNEEFLRIGVHDIEGSLRADEVGEQLTRLAETCLRAAVEIARREVLSRSGVPARGPSEGFAVLGMGKLGSAELGYASDLDLIYIYDPGDLGWWSERAVPHEFFTRIAQRTMSALQTPTREGVVYRIDTRLRPSGNQGPLVSSLEAFEAYHRVSAELWERQALIRARPVAGPAELCVRLEAIVSGFVYGRGLTDEEVAEIARMRGRIEREVDGEDSLNIKTGRGGLIDVEFLVQMLQLRHGHAHPGLRTRVTAVAIAELAREDILSAPEGGTLARGYAFLRNFESRLRIERNQPVESPEADPEALVSLARRLGYHGSDGVVVASLLADLARHREAVRAVYDRHFGSAAG